MAKFRLPINNFILGEVSSKFYGRYDIQEISQACRNLLNSLVRPQGGAFRRPGSRFVTHQSINTSSVATTLDSVAKFIPWIISKTESYVLMIVPTASAVTDISVYRLSNDTWYPCGGLADYGYAGADPFYTGFTAAQVPNIKHAQFGDTMVLTHPDHAPIMVRRLSATAFGYHTVTVRVDLYDPNGTPSIAPASTIGGAIVNIDTMPFHSNLNTAHTLSVSATSGSGVTLTSNQGLFTSSYVGARFRLFDAGTGTWGTCIVSAVTNTLLATANIIAGSTMGSTTATAVWQESSWSAARGWPRGVAFYESRLCFGGNTSFPNSLWFSQIDDIFEFSRPVVGGDDTHAFSFPIAIGELNAIQWLSAGKTLAVGTLGQEILVYGTDPNEAISNGNSRASPETGYGSEYVRPLRIDNALLFVQRNGLKVREFQFNFNEDAYNSRDLNRFADHMAFKAYDYYASVTIPKIIEMAYLSGDNPVIFTLDNNGVLNALVRDKESTAIAWSPLKLGGAFGSNEPPVVLSMCAVASVSGLDDELWLYVKRTVNSSTVYFIERITREFFGEDLDQASALNSHFYPYYLDCAINQTLGAPATAFNGFTRLNGETVHVLADGNYVGTKTVAANTITLSSNATTITAGYTYTNIVSPILPNVGSVIGNAIGAIRRIHDLFIRFRRSVVATFGRTTDAADAEEITFREASDPLSDPIPLFDGIKRRNFNGEYDRDPQIFIYNEDPLPMEVTSFSADGFTDD